MHMSLHDLGENLAFAKAASDILGLEGYVGQPLALPTRCCRFSSLLRHALGYKRREQGTAKTVAWQVHIFVSVPPTRQARATYTPKMGRMEGETDALPKSAGFVCMEVGGKTRIVKA